MQTLAGCLTTGAVPLGQDGAVSDGSTQAPGDAEHGARAFVFIFFVFSFCVHSKADVAGIGRICLEGKACTPVIRKRTH